MQGLVQPVDLHTKEGAAPSPSSAAPSLGPPSSASSSSAPASTDASAPVTGPLQEPLEQVIENEVQSRHCSPRAPQPSFAIPRKQAPFAQQPVQVSGPQTSC